MVARPDLGAGAGIKIVTARSPETSLSGCAVKARGNHVNPGGLLQKDRAGRPDLENGKVQLRACKERGKAGRGRKVAAASRRSMGC